MKILSVNAGSSSLKFQLYEMPEERALISGVFERIGIDNSFYTIKLNGEKIKKEVELKDHKDAFEILVKELIDNKVINSCDEMWSLIINSLNKNKVTYVVGDFNAYEKKRKIKISKYTKSLVVTFL